MKTVAIVGSHQETRENAPFDDPDIDIWVFNEAFSQKVRGKDGEPYQWCKRADVVFQMHAPGIYKNPLNRSDKNHWQWLQQEHGELVIYMMEQDAEVPNAKRYPLEELCADLLGEFPYTMLTSTPALSIALAVYLGYERILFYGIEMQSDTEYRYQREGVIAWTYYALGKGVQVELHSAHEAFDQPIYGYEGRVTMEAERFDKRVDELVAMRQEAVNDIRKVEDALAVMWDHPKQLSGRISELGEAHDRLGYIDGCLHEARRYAHKAHEMIEVGGEFYADRNENESTAAFARKDIDKWSGEVFRTAGVVGYMLAVYDDLRSPSALHQLQQFAEQHCNMQYNNGKAKGIVDENWTIAQEIDKTLRAAGGQKALDMLKAANHAA